MAEISKTNPQLVTILPGTPNAHTFKFNDPKNPTLEELNKVREYYGIPLDVSPQEAEKQLNALGQVQAANIIAQIPYDPGTKEYYSELSARIADVNQRMKLIEDPANYYFKHLQQKVPDT
jgi:septation ring formation regulator EzrA